jgi:hypothetical protein
MSKFITPRVVSTIAQSRLDYNQSITSLLQNFSSDSTPISTDISLEGVNGLQTGMFWYKSGGNSNLGQNRVLVYDGSSFTRNGIGTFQMSSVSAANTAVSEGNLEYGDLVLVGSDVLYIVNAAETGVVPISSDAVTLSGLTASQFVRNDIDSSITSNTNFNSNNFVKVPIGATAQRPQGTSAKPGHIRYNTELLRYEGYHETTWETLSRPISEANSTNFSANVVFIADNGINSYVNSSFKFNPSTGTVSATIFNSTSDITLKENIREIPDALDKLEMLSGYIFNFIGQTQDSAGVLAQELQEVLPECVTEIDGVLQVNYAGALALILQGFKEYRNWMHDKIDYIESRIDER